jgi:glucokinase
MPPVILAADVGGTKTALALVERGAPPRAPHRDGRFPSRNYASLEAMVREFVAAGNERVTHAAVGIAGPVVHQRVETTNLPWKISSESLSESLGGAEVVLMNDLETTRGASRN